MSTEKEDREAKLPKWAQEKLDLLRLKLDCSEGQRRQLEEASSVVHGKQWFTLPGPFGDDDSDMIHLWSLRYDQPVRVCCLNRGDVLLVGRAALGGVDGKPD